MRVVPALAVVITALALYVSRGVLDQIFTPSGLIRVALLPPWQSLAGFLGVGVLALIWLQRGTVPRGSASAIRPGVAALVLPALALFLLLLPYLPVVPDLLPAIQVLSGPLRAVVWLAVVTQLAWVLWQTRLFRADWLQRLTVRQLAGLIAVATIATCGSAALRMIDSVLYPGGDEPHYLVIAQSLWRDGDLKIENNHTRGDYYEYFDLELAPHYLTRGADEEIYSIHPVGMPVLIAPIYAAGGYRAVVAAFVAMAALAATLMWLGALRLTNTIGAATFAWAAVVATAPFLYNSFAIYPEIPAAVAVVVAFTLIAITPARTSLAWLTIGCACAALPWLSTKYAPMSAALVMIALARIYFPGGRRTGALGAPGAETCGLSAAVRTVALLVPYGLSLAGWFYFFYAIWGVALPQAPYGALVQTDLRFLLFGAPGLLFDQEYGLLPYAPVYVLAATGLWTMVRADVESRRRAIEIVLVFAALLGTVGAFRIWWGGSASPGRPVTSGLLLLVVPIAFAFRAAAAGSAQRAAQHLLLWISVGVAVVLLFAQQGLLTANGRDGTSTLLQYFSPRWPAWTVAPSFIYHEPMTALLGSALWLLLAGAVALILRRVRTNVPGRASLAAILLTASALVMAAVVMPRVPVSPAWPSIDVRARARLPVFDEFDTVARPLAVEYAPFRFTSPDAILAQASVIVEPALRTEPQPIRVLHNGRFSLPAGTYRIEIDWSGTRPGEVLGLQIGRIGDPVLSWTVDARPGERWTANFSTPVDAPFVGLRGSGELERVIQRIRFVPVSIVNEDHRPRGPAVIAASQSGPAFLFYYDTNASPERNGFWVWGARRTLVTISRPSGEAPLVLRVHSGPVTNRLRVSKFGWTHRVALPPEKPEDFEVPVDGAAAVTLEFESDVAFVPRELNPASTDTRALGVWVEVVK